MPKISIFLPYYNDETFLADSIQSVLNQTFSDFELILFNHASKDSSRKIAHSFDDQRIKHIDSNINYEAGCGLNLWNNIHQLNGEYIKVFCADDILEKTHLEELYNNLQENPQNAFVITTKAQYINQDNLIMNDSFDYFHKLNVLKSKNPRYSLIELFFNSRSIIPWGGALIRKEAIQRIIKDNSLIYMFDMSVWLQLLIQNEHFGIIDKSLYFYRKHSNAMMSQNLLKVFAICYFEHLAFNEIFYKIQDINLVKYLCRDIKNINKLSEEDVDIIPYFMAQKHFSMDITSYNLTGPMDFIYKNSAYIHFYKLFQCEKTRTKLDKKYNFTIKDFRKLYTNLNNNLLADFSKVNIVERKTRFIQKIFSMRNDNNHKVIYIFGIKIKFINKKKLK